MGALVFSLFLAIMASTTQSRWVPDRNHLLMPGSSSPGLHASTINCDSWRFAVETNNHIDWELVPKDCAAYVGKYMESTQYHADCDFVVNEAINYVESLTLTSKDTWVFDIDETALSNLDYYARDESALGSKPRDRDTFYEWVNTAKVPALPAALKLYKFLVKKNIKIVFLSGSADFATDARNKNFEYEGYTGGYQLILRSKEDYNNGLSGEKFKSAKRKELEENDHIIIGNIGDQWSDLSGTNVGKRTFKLPNPMYYISK
ncbi:hypothetical protein LguiB_011261 [Lonicera macranthoides]